MCYDSLLRVLPLPPLQPPPPPEPLPMSFTSRILSRVTQVDWVFLIACMSWGLTTALMLYVKLRKKTESFPVLILVAIFLLYMNSTDMFKRFRLYTVAAVNRRILAHQFLVCLVFGFVSNSYSDILVMVLLVGVCVLRPGWSFGKCGLPVIGPVLGQSRKTLVALGFAAQCFGYVTGTIVSIAMISDIPRADTSAASTIVIPTDPAVYRVVSAFAITLLLTQMMSARYSKLRGELQTVLGSGLISSVVRIISPGAVPVIITALLGILATTFPGAVTGVSSFLPQLVNVNGMSKARKFSVFTTVVGLHILGAVLGGVATDWCMPSISAEWTVPEFVSQQAIGQEFLFSLLVGYVATMSVNSVPLVMLAGWLATMNSEMVHLNSAISFANVSTLSNGRIIAHLLWQTLGSLVGATVVARFVDSDWIDFDPITSVTRTTDGQRIENGVNKKK